MNISRISAVPFRGFLQGQSGKTEKIAVKSELIDVLKAEGNQVGFYHYNKNTGNLDVLAKIDTHEDSTRNFGEYVHDLIKINERAEQGYIR